MMVLVFTIYGVIMSVIGMFVALTQVDFMFIRITADLIVNSHTTFYFLRGKEVNSERYNEWKKTSSDTGDVLGNPFIEIVSKEKTRAQNGGRNGVFLDGPMRAAARNGSGRKNLLSTGGARVIPR
jgi:hypothetical protein